MSAIKPNFPQQEIEEYVERIAALSRQWEFCRFTIGTHLRLDLPEEEALHLRKTLNRNVALAVEERLPGKEPAIDDTDITFLLTYPGKWVEPVPTPLFVYGRYLKLSRDLPQARWLCMKCRGRGCPRCNGKGRLHESSVEDIIAAPLLEATGAEGTKMHATGRQDIDVRMLGNGRPFAVELIRPRRRFLDYRKIEEQINNTRTEPAAQPKVAVRELQPVSREIVRKVDTARADKTYRALVEMERPLDAEAIMAGLASLSGIVVFQQTPERVVHRRADKIRERKLLEVNVLLPYEDAGGGAVSRFVIELRTESGTYIKEFVSGDGGRTNPSVAGILQVPCRCVELDVMAVHFDPFDDAQPVS